MVSLVALAELSDAAYQDRGPAKFRHGDGWQVWTRAGAWRNRIGFHASLFTADDGQQVLAFRGTEDLFDALMDDAAIVAGSIPPQLLPALVVATQLGAGARSTWLTGHSLGGALALLVGAKRNMRTATFNAPGVLDACLQVAGLTVSPTTAHRCTTASRVVNVRIDGDPVSSRYATGSQVGQATALAAPQCGIDSLCRHGIATCIAALRRAPENYRDLPID